MTIFSFIFLTLGYLVAIIGPIVIHQCYLSKYQHKSPFYWRRIPYLAAPIFQLARNKFLRLTMSTACVFAFSEYPIKQYGRALKCMPCSFRLIYLFERLDDIIDTALPEEILALGPVTLGPHLCPFLLKFLSPTDHQTLNRLVDAGVITQPELYAFGNLLALMILEQTTLTLRYAKESSPTKKAFQRKQIAQKNLDIAGCYCVLATHLVKKDPRILALVSGESSNELTYESLKAIYPVVAKGGELFQILHDTSEFRYDLINERAIGKISPNYFLSQLESHNNLADIHQQLSLLPSRPVNFYELPEEARLTFLQLQDQFMQDAFQVGRLLGWIYTLIWEYNYHVGFIVKKKKRLLQVQRPLQSFAS